MGFGFDKAVTNTYQSCWRKLQILVNCILLFDFSQADRRDVLMHEPSYNNVVHKATEFLESSGPGPQRDEISTTLHDVKSRWEELKRKTDERHAQLEDVLPLAQKYHDNSQNVKDVVTLAETELGSHASVSPDVEIAKQELQTIKVRIIEFIRVAVNSTCTNRALVVKPTQITTKSSKYFIPKLRYQPL